MDELYVHPHALKHGLSEEEILFAWENYLRKQHRKSPEEDLALAVGYNRSGELIQMVGREASFGILVYHAMTPPTVKVLRELGLSRRQQ